MPRIPCNVLLHLSSSAAGRSSLVMLPSPINLPAVSVIPIIAQSGTGISSAFLIIIIMLRECSLAFVTMVTFIKRKEIT